MVNRLWTRESLDQFIGSEFNGQPDPRLVVDYVQTQDAIKQVLQQLNIPEGRWGDSSISLEMLKDKLITEDDERRVHQSIQELTDRFIAQVDQIADEKQKEIMAF